MTMLAGIKKIRVLIILPVAVLIIGTVGFMLLQDLSFIDAFYFTIVTISTVGYGDIHPTTDASKGFSIFLIIIGIGTFLTIVTSVTQMMIQRGQNRVRRHRLNMLIGVFYTEIGNRLLRILSGFDPEIDTIREEFKVHDKYTEVEFNQLRRRLQHYDFAIDPELLDLDILLNYLKEKCDLLVRELENPDLIEHEYFTELLWAAVHLRDELVSRDSLSGLPESDLAHLANDVKRAYRLLTLQWINYMQYLKGAYPFLFSLALRTNPFIEKPSAIVR
jgi:voltage-gated potassium channel